MPKYSELAADYSQKFASCLVLPQHLNSVNAAADALLKGRGRYSTVEAATKVPWWVIGILHSMEADCNFNCHLHNGDSLKHRTVHEPAGRPIHGDPPFTWEESAIDALEYDGLEGWENWCVPAALYMAERYNGFGSRAKGRPSAYLWSFTNIYVGGKWVADHVWDPNAWSGQVGFAAILRILIDRKLVEPSL